MVEAKTMVNQKTKKVSYYFSESPHSLCLDKEDIMLVQIHAFERLLILTEYQTDLAAVEEEISQLKFVIELMKS
ncbi:hypothetical protein [Candidatus Nitrosocosmicus arcticus]|uniref:Uncharacterized protein n=1 Tax=Candidatus Nitrosocosmicus arcticus TaxID=2035267 RepID=A0A557SZG8_9ARCH|nr:hypothetical protein [Candidatus Nitrosocosmicus arcticus]TVP41993.1 hypothetical protein NARC_10399 [Candidatus Nitrosocosmicus arcticus]